MAGDTGSIRAHPERYIAAFRAGQNYVPGSEAGPAPFAPGEVSTGAVLGRGLHAVIAGFRANAAAREYSRRAGLNERLINAQIDELGRRHTEADKPAEPMVQVDPENADLLGLPRGTMLKAVDAGRLGARAEAIRRMGSGGGTGKVDVGGQSTATRNFLEYQTGEENRAADVAATEAGDVFDRTIEWGTGKNPTARLVKVEGKPTIAEYFQRKFGIPDYGGKTMTPDVIAKARGTYTTRAGNQARARAIAANRAKRAAGEATLQRLGQIDATTAPPDTNRLAPLLEFLDKED